MKLRFWKRAPVIRHKLELSCWKPGKDGKSINVCGNKNH